VAPLSFGTDGVRGRANDELTPEYALAFGRAVVRVLRPESIYLGRDTRRSGSMLAAAVGAGAASEGADVVDLGVLPTGGVAARCASDRVPGVVVSASHNPFEDNGLKALSAKGSKLASSIESEIESEIEREVARGLATMTRPTGAQVGAVRRDDAPVDTYVAGLLASAGSTRLDGLHLVVDCANGAASGIAPAVLRTLGAVVTAIGDAPDGCNINLDCGSTAPGVLAAAVLASHADLGVALDGDADRCVAVDATGHVLDGDWLLALFATDAHARGSLTGGIVVTVMSNLGLHRAMRTAGIDVVEVPLGDRHVAEALERTGWSLGGEQSGHVIFADRATTGDGVLTGMLLAQLIAERGPLDQLTDGLIVPVPQLLVNVQVPDTGALADATEIWAHVEKSRAALGEYGRVLVRASGTEPLVRIMVEAENEAEMRQTAEELRVAVLEALGNPRVPG
jgi:phosphoglucosamine mutase